MNTVFLSAWRQSDRCPTQHHMNRYCTALCWSSALMIIYIKKKSKSCGFEHTTKIEKILDPAHPKRKRTIFFQL